MKKDIRIFLNHILDSIIVIEEYTNNVDKKTFFESKQIQDAVIRRLEIIGEAIRHIPYQFREKYPSIPWKKIAGIRDILIHEYFAVDYSLTWKVVVRDAPKFKKQIIKILEELK